jgi:hypothetical protein
LDYKPAAENQNALKVASQLYQYASALSFRTRVPLKNIRCAWFDEESYYEYSPSEANITPAKKKGKR